ncbi:MAG: DUF3192 domain-containing protein [Gemmatimonadales bacterium]|nr:MAG: DUF3192 domain-containing protein [Gemmatimonadales bacterium]
MVEMPPETLRRKIRYERHGLSLPNEICVATSLLPEVTVVHVHGGWMSVRAPSEYVRAMKKYLVVCGMLALGGCASATSFRQSNRVNLDKLVLGMDRLAVLGVMGVGEQRQFTGSEIDAPIGTGRDSAGVMSVQIPIGGNRPVLYNPHRGELYNADRSSWEVFYYYTRVVHNDGMVTEDELTPIVLRDDVLIGWGWSFWAEEVRASEIPAELPEPLPLPEATP